MELKELDRSAVADYKERPVRVLQFGEGNFLRAFVDWQIDIANEKGVLDTAVTIVSPRFDENRAIKLLKEQQCVYHVLLEGIENGKPKREIRLISSVNDVLAPEIPADYEKYVALITSPEFSFVVSNTTEAGIRYDKDDVLSDKPVTFPGKVTNLLWKRYKHFNGAADKGLVFICCELIENNATTLHEYVLRHAREAGMPGAFIEWIDSANIFVDTLVDRIVPGFPRDTIDEVKAELGYDDNVVDKGEFYHLWAIGGKGYETVAREFPLDKAGLHVLFMPSIKAFRDKKVRILNGAHTSMVLGAYLAGHEIVGDCMADDTMRAYMSQALFNEIMPTLDLPKDDLEAFASAIFERFSNPFNRHLLLSIALNSQSKFRARVLPTIKEYVKRTGRLPKILTFSMAAFIAFYCGKKKEDGSFVGVRAAGNEYPIADDQFVLDFFAGMTGKPAAEIAHAVLTNVDFWGSDLTAELPGFEASVAASLDAIFTKGAAKAIEEVVARA